MIKKILIISLLLTIVLSCSVKDSHMVVLTTPHGDIKIQLYDETPIHRDNFIKLVSDGFYDGILFHRVINNFMIQTGDPQTKKVESDFQLPESIKAEFIPGLFHKKGALAAARRGDNVNPERESSGSQFYLVQGRVYSPEELDNLVSQINENRKRGIYEKLRHNVQQELSEMEISNNRQGIEKLTQQLTAICDSLFQTEQLLLTDEQREAYTTIGGTPHLDGQYSVFGEVVEGLEVIDKIAAEETGPGDRPIKDIAIIKAKLVKR